MESKKNKMASNITWREKIADLALFGGLIWTLFLTLWAHDADAQNLGVLVWVWLLVLCFFVCVIFSNKSGSVHNASCRLSQFFDCAKISVALIFFLGSILCVHLRIPVLAICIPALLYSVFLIVFLEVLSLVFKVKVRTNEKNKHKEPACTKELVTKPHKRLAYAMRGISLPICDCGYWEEKARAKQAKKRNKGGVKRMQLSMSKNKKISTALMVLMILPLCVTAKDFGTRGQVFPVKEQDFRVFIQSRLHSMQVTGELANYEKQAKARVAKHAYRPTPLKLGMQSDSTTRFVDPTIVLNRDISDQLGRVLVKAGTRVNPFKTVHLRETLIFFNGDDARQVNWVAHHYQEYHWVKFILTGGDIRDAAKRFGRIYFDQYGRLTQKLHIKHVPAVAQQDHLKWKITTIGTKEF